MHAILAKWVPIEERSHLSATVYSGMSLGTGITMAVSGFLIHFFGWPFVFYVSGILTIFWFIFWCLFVFDTPAEHPRISEEELKYITNSLSQVTERENNVSEN